MNYIEIRKIALLLMALTIPLGASIEYEKEDNEVKVTKSENKIDANLNNQEAQEVKEEDRPFYQTGIFKVSTKATICAIISFFLFNIDKQQNNNVSLILAGIIFPFIKALATYCLLEYKITGLSRRISIPLTYGGLETILLLIEYASNIFGTVSNENLNILMVGAFFFNNLFALTSFLIVYLMGIGINYL